VQHWRKLKLIGQRTGPSDAPAQIVEFFDYQCPFCKEAQPVIKTIRREYPQKVAVVHINFPLQMHQYAFDAAIAAECARRLKPTIFMGYHDSLFANQARLGRISYTRMAARVGISDTTTFHQCIATKKTAGIIKSGEKLADSLNIHAIPTFLINDELITGALTKQQLDKLVQKELSKAGK
jgi:protein-disulfide isomerase